jgi:hypothetical protein
MAKAELAIDKRGLPAADPGPEAVIAACTAWLCAAQDNSASKDGGVARDFSLLKGWSTSYPETTGYIIPTMIALASRNDDPACTRARAACWTGAWRSSSRKAASRAARSTRRPRCR